METTSNQADNLERLLADNFTTWGFVIYRTTYASDADWRIFMALFLDQAKRSLKFYNGLDLLDTFALAVFEHDAFNRAPTAIIRAHFNRWARTAIHQEQGLPLDSQYYPHSGRYRFLVMVDQEALESVSTMPYPNRSRTSFVRLVNGEWEPELLDEEVLEALGGPPEEFEPLEGCTLKDVGWMKVPYDEVEFSVFVYMCDSN